MSEIKSTQKKKSCFRPKINTPTKLKVKISDKNLYINEKILRKKNSQKYITDSPDLTPFQNACNQSQLKPEDLSKNISSRSLISGSNINRIYYNNNILSFDKPDELLNGNENNKCQLKPDKLIIESIVKNEDNISKSFVKQSKNIIEQKLNKDDIKNVQHSEKRDIERKKNIIDVMNKCDIGENFEKKEKSDIIIKYKKKLNIEENIRTMEENIEYKEDENGEVNRFKDANLEKSEVHNNIKDKKKENEKITKIKNENNNEQNNKRTKENYPDKIKENIINKKEKYEESKNEQKIDDKKAEKNRKNGGISNNSENLNILYNIKDKTKTHEKNQEEKKSTSSKNSKLSNNKHEKQKNSEINKNKINSKQEKEIKLIDSKFETINKFISQLTNKSDDAKNNNNSLSIKGDESEDPFETVIQEYRVKKQGRIDDNKKINRENQEEELQKKEKQGKERKERKEKEIQLKEKEEKQNSLQNIKSEKETMRVKIKSTNNKKNPKNFRSNIIETRKPSSEKANIIGYSSKIKIKKDNNFLRTFNSDQYKKHSFRNTNSFNFFVPFIYPHPENVYIQENKRIERKILSLQKIDKNIDKNIFSSTYRSSMTIYNEKNSINKNKYSIRCESYNSKNYNKTEYNGIRNNSYRKKNNKALIATRKVLQEKGLRQSYNTLSNSQKNLSKEFRINNDEYKLFLLNKKNKGNLIFPIFNDYNLNGNGYDSGSNLIKKTKKIINKEARLPGINNAK